MNYHQEMAGIISASGVSTPLPDIRDETKDFQEVPWNVVVYNDPVNLMSYVTKVFIKILGFSHEKAEQHMMEVHKKGRSVVWSGERERAEFYIQQLHGALLLASLERSV
jgi:ATP-dependent Clp protease adaptor protein ClpS